MPFPTSDLDLFWGWLLMAQGKLSVLGVLLIWIIVAIGVGRGGGGGGGAQGARPPSII